MPTIGYSFWQEYNKNHPENILSGFMVNLSFLFFLIAEVFLFIILVNFFIAMVGQIYDDTMANS